MSACVAIGRGFNYCTAFELALKLKELTYTVVEPYSSADFLHGPLALVERGLPGDRVAPSGKMLPEIKTFMATAQEREAELVVISDDAEALSMARIPLPLPAGVPEWLSPHHRHPARPALRHAPGPHARLRPRPAAPLRKVTETM